ncbi:protein-glutamate O-methyltransferase CheR [Seleniivibrio woodruffii]|uniref:CheR family methyltransferase n=1 Tax=Seleniivibrio woodruffii TaxID=1078050 RepID=UPI0026EF9AC0|nr:CheR family methyltransferase [Seleniivibrio woodruffii]
MTSNIFSKKLEEKDFNRLKTFIESSCGIKLSENKKSMVEGRLRKRIKALGMDGYSEYVDFVFDGGRDSIEQTYLIDVITTNKTDFFRENNHFEMMSSKILPMLSEKGGLGHHRPLRVWSCASSTGEEPYTIAMVLAEYFGVNGKFSIFATDINTSVLSTAKRAIYTEDRARDIPYELKKKYLLRSKNPDDRLVRFRPEIRSKVKFARLNLKSSHYMLPESVDIVFCRNVLIYFDIKTQEEMLNRICSHMNPGGFLFMGHSESIHGLRLPVKSYAPTIYIRD